VHRRLDPWSRLIVSHPEHSLRDLDLVPGAPAGHEGAREGRVEESIDRASFNMPRIPDGVSAANSDTSGINKPPVRTQRDAGDAHADSLGGPRTIRGAHQPDGPSGTGGQGKPAHRNPSNPGDRRSVPAPTKAHWLERAPVRAWPPVRRTPPICSSREIISRSVPIEVEEVEQEKD
jgi:hypothetical protein